MPKIPRLIFCHACMIVFVWALSTTADELRPDSGYLHDKDFVAQFDAVCGAGKKLSDGCDAIRARRIVDATTYPWRAIGRVNFASIELRHHCTGTLFQSELFLRQPTVSTTFPESDGSLLKALCSLQASSAGPALQFHMHKSSFSVPKKIRQAVILNRAPNKTGRCSCSRIQSVVRLGTLKF